jgi:hypothetical protein
MSSSALAIRSRMRASCSSARAIRALLVFGGEFTGVSLSIQCHSRNGPNIEVTIPSRYPGSSRDRRRSPRKVIEGGNDKAASNLPLVKANQRKSSHDYQSGNCFKKARIAGSAALPQTVACGEKATAARRKGGEACAIGADLIDICYLKTARATRSRRAPWTTPQCATGRPA